MSVRDDFYEKSINFKNATSTQFFQNFVKRKNDAQPAIFFFLISLISKSKKLDGGKFRYKEKSLLNRQCA